MSSPELVLDGIEQLYRAAVDPGCWPDALHSLREVFASDACAIARHDFGARDGAYLHQTGYRPDLIARYPGPLARANPWLRDEARFRTPGAAWTGRDLASDRELLRSPFYGDWLQRQGLLHQSCGVIAREGDAVIYLENLRRSARRAFDRRHLRAYAILLPHLQRAGTLARLLPGAARQTTPLDQTVRQAPEPLILLDKRAGVVAASGAAGGGLDDTSPGRRRPGRRAGPRRRPRGLERARERESLRRRHPAARASHRRRAPGTGAAGRGARGRGARRGARCRARRHALLPLRPPEDRLRPLYHLTRAEARLAVLLARGRTLQAAAEALGRGITTVRTHLQRIFA